MKLQGFVGKGTGKLGASVWTVRKGVQVVREYTSKVSNPNTRPQVMQRAKFKLLTQLSAVIGNAGMHFDNFTAGASMRNEFMKRNMNAVEVLENTSVATLKTGDLKLTSGSFFIPTPLFDETNRQVSINLAGTEFDDIAGATIVVITQPEVGRVIGYSQRVDREEGEEKIVVPIIVPSVLMNKTAALVWLWRFRDAAARANYAATIARDPDNITLSFNRFVEQGDIVVSTTVMAARK